MGSILGSSSFPQGGLGGSRPGTRDPEGAVADIREVDVVAELDVHGVVNCGAWLAGATWGTSDQTLQ